MKIQEICNKELCTGCSACVQICPKQCLLMKPDSEGFLRPVIAGDACVDCGLCQKTCPVNHPIEDDLKVPMAFAARHKDENIRHVSSSGGAFSALAMNILSRGGVVIAAGFDQQHMVVHKVCTDVSLLDELRRSKYVQSDINGTFQQAETFLQAGREVIFCGTPCQVGGLCAYLKKDYPNLYTVDFICHGVPSPTAWKKYLEYCKTNAGVAVKLVNFRSKVKGWKTYSMEITFEDGTKFSNTVREDMYLRSFIMDMDLRPSCYQCRFKQIHRQADITIADFWETRLLNKAWNDDKGVSLVLVHSDKGCDLVDGLDCVLDMLPVPFDEAIRSNPSMKQSVRKPALRKRFMRDLQKMSFHTLHGKYCGTSLIARLRRKIAKEINRQ